VKPPSPEQSAVSELRIIIVSVDAIDGTGSDIAGTEFGRKVSERGILRTGSRFLFRAC